MTHKRNAEREAIAKHLNLVDSDEVEIDMSAVTEPEADEDEETEAEETHFTIDTPGIFREMHGRNVQMIPLKPWLLIPCADCGKPAAYEVYEAEGDAGSFFYCGVCEIG